MGSSIKSTLLEPAWRAASSTARRSTSVTPEGMHTTMRGRLRVLDFSAFLMKYFSMAAVTSKSAMTPSFKGRTATMEPGVRPSISLACLPTASTSSVRTSTATTEGSRITMPLPRINTSVFAVPKSMPMSLENIVNIENNPERNPVAAIQYLCLSSPLGPVISKLYTAVKKPLGFMVSHFRGNTRMKPPRARKSPSCSGAWAWARLLPL